MKYSEYLARETFNQQELIAASHGTLVEDPPPAEKLARLPTPPFLMFDRITQVKHGSRGRIVAEQDVRLDAWYFQGYFVGDPILPPCLTLDAVWQLIGFFLVLSGYPGSGRALGCRETHFLGDIRPHNRNVRYEVDLRRCMIVGFKDDAFGIGTGKVFADGSHVCTFIDAKVGLFRGGINYPDYPLLSEHARGGLMQR